MKVTKITHTVETVVGTIVVFIFLWLVSFAAKAQQIVTGERRMDVRNLSEIHLVKGNTNSRTQSNDETTEMKSANEYRVKQAGPDAQSPHSNIENLNAMDMKNIDKSNIVSIWPNPVNAGNFVLNMNSTGTTLSVGIFDLYGRQLLNDLTLSAAKSTHVIPAGDFKQGIYFIRVYENGNLIENDKFLVE